MESNSWNTIKEGGSISNRYSKRGALLAVPEEFYGESLAGRFIEVYRKLENKDQYKLLELIKRLKKCDGVEEDDKDIGIRTGCTDDDDY